jgi:TATA-box binding protein (TBP) (component of TFIID and TFIIIB)
MPICAQYIYSIPINKIDNDNINENDTIKQIRNRAKTELEICKLPDDVSISTMTIICNIDTVFLCGNIARYVELKSNGILSVTHGKDGDPKTNRTLIPKKHNKSKKKKKKKNVFYNQVSMYVNVSGKKKPVNVKLFSNGAIQMTGCKIIDNAIEALNKILPTLKEVKAVVNYKKMEIDEKPFAENPNFLELKNVKKFKIVMINSNFKIPFSVDRFKLYNLLLENKYDCYYEPVKHACVNIKYDHSEKVISIFVFEKGAIIVTGARNCGQILDGYNFINKYLLSNHKHIVKHDNLTNSNIIKYLNPTDYNHNKNKQLYNYNISDLSDYNTDINDDDTYDIDIDVDVDDDKPNQPVSIDKFNYFDAK